MQQLVRVVQSSGQGRLEVVQPGLQGREVSMIICSSVVINCIVDLLRLHGPWMQREAPGDQLQSFWRHWLRKAVWAAGDHLLHGHHHPLHPAARPGTVKTILHFDGWVAVPHGHLPGPFVHYV